MRQQRALWNLGVTNVPGPQTIESYIALAVVGRRAGTVLPYARLVCLVVSVMTTRVQPLGETMRFPLPVCADDLVVTRRS